MAFAEFIELIESRQNLKLAWLPGTVPISQKIYSTMWLLAIDNDIKLEVVSEMLLVLLPLLPDHF